MTPRAKERSGAGAVSKSSGKKRSYHILEKDVSKARFSCHSKRCKLNYTWFKRNQPKATIINCWQRSKRCKLNSDRWPPKHMNTKVKKLASIQSFSRATQEYRSVSIWETTIQSRPWTKFFEQLNSHFKVTYHDSFAVSTKWILPRCRKEIESDRYDRRTRK